MRGLANNEKRRAIFDKHRANADILILQETHSCKEFENIWVSEWGGKQFMLMVLHLLEALLFLQQNFCTNI